MSDLPPFLKDPRQYAAVPLERNVLLNEAMQCVSDEPSKFLINQVANSLMEDNEGLRFSVALNMVPSDKEYRLLWKALSANVQHIIAWPVLFIIPPKQHSILPELPCWPGMLPLWLSASDLQKIKPSVIYRAQKKEDLSSYLPEVSSSIQPSSDYVHIRYWLGFVQDFDDTLNHKHPRSLVYDLMLIFNQFFKAYGLINHHAMPFAPLPFFSSYAVANLRARDVAFQIFVGQRLRELRQKAYRPTACIVTLEDNLHIRFKLKENLWDSERWVWPLLPGDDFSEVIHLIKDFLAECHVSSIEWQR